ncbi:hypothetical protein TREAZ_0560 [Leadbettera azotonutricia ZAS-9]|uniref:Uncharacterized protein n=1 Tax=Leadbettera azotonutricia (strain ATCC BAA-888 / DSM 13862 / ZAS-9) TaxID=545695 RepID=F5YBL6_LEAAZ|nr:hypothetical protein TREAZ_0560 [Leadbettera azotonutricia ZAS-9]
MDFSLSDSRSEPAEKGTQRQKASINSVYPIFKDFDRT